MNDPLRGVNLRRTSQTEQADVRQVGNSAGGYTFRLDPMAQLLRFLILGTEGGTYYAGAGELTRENAGLVMQLAKTAGRSVVDLVVEVSQSGRAPKQNHALFTLAVVCALGDADARQHAGNCLPLVARTGTHLFQFATYVQQFRGWGRGLRRAVAGWYEGKTPGQLAYQMVKYRQRGGWTHRDLLRLAHPASTSLKHAELYAWACGRWSKDLPYLINCYDEAQRTDMVARWTRFAMEGPMTWEMFPTEALKHKAVWEALVDGGIPQMALMRNLGRLTRLGVLQPMSERLGRVVAQLTDQERIAKARFHPLAILVALRTYASGEGLRGKTTWEPIAAVVDALNEAFYLSFGSVIPANKRTLLALDVSGSMAWKNLAGMPITPREASAALAMLVARTEPQSHIMAFGSVLMPLNIGPSSRLDDATRAAERLPFGQTDCALPMLWALARGVGVDTFVVITDNETYAGSIHPHQALREYRNHSGIPARLAVVGMTSTGFTIADPSDAGQMDMVGFDTASPTLLSAFSRGEF